MNNEYYNFTLEHSYFVDGLRIAATESLICLKAKAFIDLTTRKQSGDKIDEKNIHKHFNDIFRLSVTFPGHLNFTLSEELNKDLTEFCKSAYIALPDNSLFKSAGLGNIDISQVFERLCSAFNIKM